MRKKDDNRGFTLAELVIAVAILAIAITPLMANFIQSSKVNLKGRKSMNATNLAQAVMEGMSVYSAAELEEIMVSANTIELGEKILPPGTDYDHVHTGKNETDSSENVYCYNINGVKTSEGNYNTYDLKVTLDATVGEENQNGFNDKEVATIAEIDQYYDATYTITEDELYAAFADLQSKASKHNNISYESYDGNMIRNMHIIIANEGTEQAPLYTVKLENTYSVKGSMLAELGLSETDVSVQSSGNISKTKQDTLPRGVYVYFEGMKNATTDNPYLENIQITNTTGQDVDIYLIRTQKKDTVNNSEVLDYNDDFRCKVDVESANSDKTSFGNVNIITNLRHNLSYSLEENRVYDDDGNRLEASETKYRDARAEFTYNNDAITEDMYKAHIFDGYKKEKKNLLYNVTIEVYETGTDNKVATYTGGLLN